MIKYASLLLLLAAALPSSSCETVCTLELLVAISPSDTTIAVGESFQAKVGLSGCGGRKTFSDEYTWVSDDSTVVVVNDEGRVTGVGVGQANVLVSGKRYGDLGGIAVTVRPASSSL
ncbi:MAG: Ig-like domain-containing protein [Gemmatimonadales bacterium]